MDYTAKKMGNEEDSVLNGPMNKYTLEFKSLAVKRIVDDGESLDDVASELGIDSDTLKRWIRSREKEMGNKIEKEAGSEDPVITRAMNWDHSSKDFGNDSIGRISNNTSQSNARAQEQTAGVIGSLRNEVDDTDMYKHQLDVQNFSNRNIGNVVPPAPPMNLPPMPIEGGSGHTSLNEILGVLQESRWFIIKSILLATLLAFVHIWLTEPVYRANALLEVEGKVRGTGVVLEPSEDFSEDAIVSEEVEILRSRTVLGAVVENLKLDDRAQPKYFPIIGASVARNNPVVTNQQVDAIQLDSIESSSVYSWVVEKIPALPGYLQFATDSIQALEIKFYQKLESSKYAWGNEQLYLENMDMPESSVGKVFTLIAGEKGGYQILDQAGSKLGEGVVGKPAEIPLNDGVLVLTVSDLIATPGKHFEIQKKIPYAAINSLQKKVIIREKAGVIKSGLLGVTLEGTDKTKISAIVNEVMDTYIRQNVDRKAADIQTKLSFMEERLAILKESMGTAEQGLNQYRQQEGSVDLATESEVVLRRIVEVEAEISLLSRSRLDLLSRFKPKHPSVRSLDGQIGTLRSEITRLNAKVKKLPGTQQQVLKMKRDVDVQSKLYSFLFNKIQEFKIITAGSVGNLRVVDYALTPIDPVKPQKNVMLVAYTLLGLILGIGASFFKRSLNATIHDPEDIERKLGLTVHATVPMSQQQAKLKKGWKRKSARKGVLAYVDPDDPAIEGLRGLRTSLYFSQFESRNNVIAVTGPCPEVGKSFISINYAAILVSSGKRVLVVDADFRRGSINEYVGMDHHEGLSDLIKGDKSLEEVIRNTDIEGLDIITTGKMPSNPSELLLNDNFAAQIQKISSYYDFVIIDTPPVLALSDAGVIGRLAGSTLLVVKSGMHPIRQLQHTIKQLTQAGVKLEGAVFNGLDTTNSAYGYGQNYGYAYSYTRRK